MPSKFSQISLFDIYEDVNTSFIEKKSMHTQHHYN